MLGKPSSSLLFSKQKTVLPSFRKIQLHGLQAAYQSMLSPSQTHAYLADWSSTSKSLPPELSLTDAHRPDPEACGSCIARR